MRSTGEIVEQLQEQLKAGPDKFQRRLSWPYPTLRLVVQLQAPQCLLQVARAFCFLVIWYRDLCLIGNMIRTTTLFVSNPKGCRSYVYELTCKQIDSA
jgi:hypothetical protein